MPDMDGFEVARQLLDISGGVNLPMVMLSSAGLKGEGSRSKELGFKAYLSKPFTSEELQQVIERVVTSAQHGTTELITRYCVDDLQAGMNILLVEDDAINQQLIIVLLKRLGHQVTLAANGQIALDAMAQQTFDLVLMDMMMPVMNGLEVTEHIRAVEFGFSHVPVVALTANVMQVDRERCFKAGMDDYLSKPIELQELKRVLKRFEPGTRKLRIQEPDVAPSIPSKNVSLESPVFDYTAALAKADREVVEIVANVFIEQWPLDVEKITQAIACGEVSTVMYVAHALKGSLGMFGAQPAVILAQELEQLSSFKGAPSVQLLSTMTLKLNAMKTQVEHLLPALHSQQLP